MPHLKRPPRTRKQLALQLAVQFLVKTTTLVGLAGIVGFSVGGPEKSRKLTAEVLPKFSLKAALEEVSIAQNTSIQQPATQQRVHHFSMTIIGGRSTIPAMSGYQRVEAEIVAKDAEPKVILRLQEIGRNQPIHEFERDVSEAYFSNIWQQLRELEVAQLTDLSPFTEHINDETNPRPKFSDTSATYRFHFKDGVYDYPNSFEVHAPEHLEDKRYQQLSALTYLVLADSFGELLVK